MDDLDVIVVGGGLAGICAAEQALRSGARTALVTKGWLGGIGVRGSGARFSAHEPSQTTMPPKTAASAYGASRRTSARMPCRQLKICLSC